MNDPYDNHPNHPASAEPDAWTHGYIYPDFPGEEPVAGTDERMALEDAEIDCGRGAGRTPGG